MDKVNDFLERFRKIIFKINQNDKKPKNFGTDTLMYQSEIHFIEAMGINEGISTSSMVQKLQITNGAITQIANKLIKKGLMERFKKADNKKVVYYRLTEKGKIAFRNHQEFHSELNEKMVNYVSSLSNDHLNALMGLLKILEQNIPKEHELL